MFPVNLVLIGKSCKHHTFKVGFFNLSKFDITLSVSTEITCETLFKTLFLIMQLIKTCLRLS